MPYGAHTVQPYGARTADYGARTVRRRCELSAKCGLRTVHTRCRHGADWQTERTARKVYRTRNQARADVFDYIELFYNPQRRHSTIGYLSPMEFERIAAAS